MSGSLPKTLEGSQSPSSLELLWERHRRKVQALFWLLALALAGYYGMRYYEQRQLDQKWSRFAASSLLSTTYATDDAEPQLLSSFQALTALIDGLKDTPLSRFDEALATADDAQVPYFLWLKANKAARAGDYDVANQAAEELKARFPKHPLCVETGYPVQVREEAETEEDETEKKKPQKPDEPELKPAVSGSTVGLLLEHLQAAKDYIAPPQFAKPEIPADAPRYRFTLDGDRGSFVVALMTGAAPKLCAKFEELAAANYWEGTKVNEIVRPTDNPFAPAIYQFQFGFETTKTEENRAEWDTTTSSPEDRVVEEFSPLSHFPGAVAARTRDSKCEVDRLTVTVSDSAELDENNQVFAYVVEGLEAARSICEADLARSEDEARGRGLPAENIAIQSVAKVE